MANFLSQMNTRTFLISIVGLISVVIIMFSTYAVLPQFKTYKSLNTNLVKLERLVNHNSKVSTNIDQLAREIDLVKRQVKGDMVDLPEKEMEAYILGVLQNISWNNNVNLIGVKPSKGNEIQIFQEVLFKVKLTGDYFDLYQWFLELREDLGFIVIKNLNLSPSQNGDNTMPLLMDLTIASYKSVKQ
jgi:Tfp pilus assembly protein PilO